MIVKEKVRSEGGDEEEEEEEGKIYVCEWENLDKPSEDAFNAGTSN